MIVCKSCSNECIDGSRFCNKCGTKLEAIISIDPIEEAPVIDEPAASVPAVEAPSFAAAVEKPVVSVEERAAPQEASIHRPASGPSGSLVTSIGVPPMVERLSENGDVEPSGPLDLKIEARPRLIIERGEAADTEFPLRETDSTIGRWDADNGIFPDVDLDAFDGDAKVSRRHARIVVRNEEYFLEDLGSTNGTFVNRGRRLLPGSPHALHDGDEIIVGKTFLRFRLG